LKKYPKVSVVVTTYNRKDYLQRVLAHYRDVTLYPNYKLIVCDDHSTDGTQQMLRKMKESGGYFDDLFISSHNLGVTNSRNQGISRNKADYYVLVDDDTMHIKGWLTEAIKILEAFPKIGSVTTQRPLWELLDEPEKLSALDLQLIKKDDVQAMLIKYIGSCMVFSHGIWKKIGPMSHPEKRSGICRYSHRITDRGYLVARTYPPMSESIDMPQHKHTLRFTKYKESYTKKVAPVNMQQLKHYEDGINQCLEFDKTHYINEDGYVIRRV